jgi:serine/threonine-protein kinase
MRRLGDEEARPLNGTEGAQVPAVSHDGQWVAFWSAGAIRKVPIAGGPVTDLAPGITYPPMGMAWDDSGRLLFGARDGRIWQIPPGAAPAAVTTVGEREGRHVLPSPLPGGRTLVYTVRKREWSWGDEQIVAHTIATGERKILLQDAADARYLPSGHLAFLRRGTLFAVGFDVTRLEVQGAPVAVLDNVVQALADDFSGDVSGAGQFAVAPTGALACIRGPVTPLKEVVPATVDRRGQVAQLPGEPGSYLGAVRLSPDGRRLAVAVRDLTEVGLWFYDLDRELLTPLHRGEEAFWPTWSPDGGRLAFSWRKDGQWSVAVQPADGTSAPQTLVPHQFYPSSWSRDGRVAGVVGTDIVVATVDGDRPNERPLGETPYVEGWPEFSPDGRWLAYGSNVTGESEVYVRSYPGPGAAERVSINGGSNPAWNPRGGSELFFVGPLDAAGKRSMLAVGISGGRPIGRPKPLFEFDRSSLGFSCSPVRCYDVSGDGQRFYVMQLGPAPPSKPVTHIDLILNWVDEVKAKARK